MVFIGIDPSFCGCGVSMINTDKKEINLLEYATDVKDGAFAQIAKVADVFSLEIIINVEKNTNTLLDSVDIIGMELPPTTGFYAVKLWALDTMLYNRLIKYVKNTWLFNVPYLKFINSKNNTKKDTMLLAENILRVFKDSGFVVKTNLVDKKGKERKYTSNQCDSFMYCTRVFIKYILDNDITKLSKDFPQLSDIFSEIVNINPRFLEQKETDIGKTLKNK